MITSLTRIKLRNFTAFESLDVELSPRINVFAGENGTGKTHLLKVLYAAADASNEGQAFNDKIAAVFMPDDGAIGRLVRRRRDVSSAKVEAFRSDTALKMRFDRKARKADDALVDGESKWKLEPTECAYIPVKEMLAHAPGFRSLYEKREIRFEQTYADIIDRAYLPALRETTDIDRKLLLNRLRTRIGGRIIQRDQTFYLRGADGTLEFPLVAEGLRKLALLWLLIQNGTLTAGSMLFWDEPEANLNPKLIRPVIDILLELARLHVQIFMATHSYFVLKELDVDIRSGKRDTRSKENILFHGLYRESKTGKIMLGSVPNYLDLPQNAIADTFGKLYERDVAGMLE